MRPANSQSRAWVFTINNPTEQLDVDFECLEREGVINFATWQLEIGESGTPHFQGYLELPRAQRMSYVSSMLPRAHLEQRRGTGQQAASYCHKPEGRLEGPWSVGTMSNGQGSRSDIFALRDAIKSGATMERLFDDHPRSFLAYQRGILAARSLFQPKREWTTELRLCIGAPGTGKTTFVRTESARLGKAEAWFKNPTKWWCTYNGEEDVCLDDFAGWLFFTDLLRLADRPPLLVEIKGGMVPFLAKRLWITSNKTPVQWFPSKEENVLEALYRRITRVYVFQSLGKYDEYASWEDCKNRKPVLPATLGYVSDEEDFSEDPNNNAQ